MLNAAELTIEPPSSDRPAVARWHCATLDEENERVPRPQPNGWRPARGDRGRASPASSMTSCTGFYRSTFTDDEGTTHAIATTQFEATDARRAFPCFDEPDRKAVFSVTLDVPAGLAAYSNGPSRRRVLLSGRASDGSASATPSPCRPIWWRSWWARSSPPSRRRAGHAGAYRPRPGQRRPHRLRPRSRRPPSAVLRATGSASSTRPRNSISSPSPTSPSAPWRTWAA